MIINAGHFTIREGAQAAVRRALLEARAQTLREPGCSAYDFAFDIADDTVVRLFEIYEDRASFDAHMDAEHTAILFDAVGRHLTDRPRMQLYEATALTSP